MTVHPRKALLASAALIGAATLGVTFSGSAAAAVPQLSAPTAGISSSPMKKSDKDDDDSNEGGYGGQFHHDHHGAGDLYDFDLYNPTEHYDENKCKNKDASRKPATALNMDFYGANGDAKDDCKYDSSDYHPKRTGFQGSKEDKDGGYNGYLGSNPKKLDKNNYGG